jgi:RimJ/RimL family protein N-acetyltransferase
MHVFIETDRLFLRRFIEADVENQADLDSDPEVMRYLSGGARRRRMSWQPRPDSVPTAPPMPRYGPCFAS